MNEPYKKETPLLFGLLVKKYDEDGRPYVQFKWLRVALLFIIMLVFTWVSIATMLYAYFKYAQDFDTVKFSNMVLLPINYSEHKTAMGNRHIERGLKALEDKDFNEGIRLLRLGLILI